MWRVFHDDGTLTFAVDHKDFRNDIDDSDMGVYRDLVEFKNKGEITKAVLID